MHTKSISGTVTASVTLGAGNYGSTLTITPTGAVEPSQAGAAAIVAPSSVSHAKLVNHGLVFGGAGTSTTADGGAGVDFAAAGQIINSGTISGGSGGNVYESLGGIGVSLGQGGAVSNTGTILGGTNFAQFYYAGTVGGIGVDLGAAGSIVNHGLIAGGNGVSAYFGGLGSIGIDLSAGGTISNTGTIDGGSAGSRFARYDGANGGTGILLGDEASITNSGTIAGGAGGNATGDEGIGGHAGVGIDFQAAGSLSNRGIISGGFGGSGTARSSEGGVGVTFEAVGTLTNSGTIDGGASYRDGGAGVSLASGSVTNSGTIAGGYDGGRGVVFSAGGTLSNAGHILGSHGRDPYSPAGGTGIFLQGTGFITNTGTIAGGDGTKVNSAHHGGDGGDGVYLQGGTLATSGLIAGGLGGKGGLGNGTPGDAVRFGTLTATLVVEPHAVFVGDIAANASVNDTLELAGKGGTLTGLGSTVTGFTTITEDAAAHWVLTGAIAGSGSLIVGSGATLILDGPATIAQVVLSAGGNELLRLETSSTLTGTISGFGTGDVIDLCTIKAASLSYDHGTLTLFDTNHTALDSLTFAGDYTQSDFTLRSDGVSGTEINYSGPEIRGQPMVAAGQAAVSPHETDTVPAFWHIAPV